MLYSEIGDNSDAQIWKLLIAEKMDQYKIPYDYSKLLNLTPTLTNLLSILYCLNGLTDFKNLCYGITVP